MNFTPQVETAEISDADLDNVSGGLHSAVANGVVGNATSTLDSIAPVSALAGTVVGTVEGATGLNTGAVTGLVAGL
ncbi:type A2 lantipeptide [Streptomyces sp. NPDC007861]|uniref:type A2 lantipeptide n=1 Tax=Streptomyces sp. NPDC007861 TaxID=3154893 RepID=UPI0033FBC3BF